ncbi:mesoderm posterior protein 1-like [Eublepharis macularius]|uniref:Mesoderm posterior protein 1-like n=1 Tax=Eublepharis macularius TaxID=481883 RepID=A0AA97LKM7_EUBMA|nr:mesoderm posterior protein 1-like [Eublepharis macularius]
MARHYLPEAASPALELPPPLSFWAPQQAWGWPAGGPPESSRGSPASSPESGAGSLSPASPPPCPCPCPRGSGSACRAEPGAKAGRRGRLGGGQRQSASQREKLRMRRLAKALHTLRRFLPASVAPAGRSLTKIQTLRLTIRYIAHLSQLLGLSHELLAWRGAARARRCQLCPPGLGCCQAPSPSPATQPEPPGRDARAAPAAQAWPSPAPCPPPPAAADAPSGLGLGPGLFPSPAADADTAAWLWASPGADGPDDAGSRTTAAEALLPAAELPQAGLSPQSLPDELLSFLEGFLPPASQD